MLSKYISGVLLLGVISNTCAEEVNVKQSNLVFEVSAQHIAELAAANIKLNKRYPDQIKRFGPVSFQSAYVASIKGQGDLKYIFVGFPMRNTADETYMSVIQYCDKIGSYELARQGLIPEKIEKVFNEFIDSNNKSLTQLPNACDTHNGED